MALSLSLKNLLETETEFLSMAVPTYACNSNEILGTECCKKLCMLSINRLQILKARYNYVQFARTLAGVPKATIRSTFVHTLSSLWLEKGFPSLSSESQTCIVLIARTYGMSVTQMISYVDSVPQNASYGSRQCYNKSVEKVSEALEILAEMAQSCPTSGLVLPPSFTDRQLSHNQRSKVSLKLIRKIAKLKVRRRKGDLLVRCSICTALKSRIRNCGLAKKREAQHYLKAHYSCMNNEKTIISALCKMSRDENKDLMVMKIDGASNRYSKMPSIISRPKTLPDQSRIAVNLTTCQVAAEKGGFSNYDYTILSGTFRNDSSYLLSILLDTLAEQVYIVSHLILVLDNCPTNKSDTLLGGLGVLMAKIPAIEKITLLYQTVGHTHCSVDAHFGVLATKLKKTDCLDPEQYKAALRGLPSVSKVSSDATIFDFVPLKKAVRKWTHRSSQHQIVLSRSLRGEIVWGSSRYITTEVLFDENSVAKNFSLFKDGFEAKNFIPTIIQPDPSGVAQEACNELFRCAGALFDDTNRMAYVSNISCFGKSAFRSIISKIGNKVAKTSPLPRGLPTESVVQYLGSYGHKSIRLSQTPVPM